MEFQKARPMTWLNALSTSIIIGLFSSFYQSQAIAKDAISLSWALQQTVANNPVLQSYPYELRIVEASQVQANLTPAPSINIELENALGSGEFTGLS